jgi:uroporphyrinogen decarboxylase
MKIIDVLKNKSGPENSIPPIWLMRQAGRYLPEYRELRATAGDFLSLCYNPDWASEVTLQPIRRFDLDAAIIFSDILVIPHALGQHLEFVKGEGPKLGELDLSKLKYNSDQLSPVYEALSKTRKALDPEKALIGFIGAPWTVACYMVEGQGSKTWDKVRLLAAQDPDYFQELIDMVTEASIDYLSNQINAGANMVQIFDSWAGVLSEEAFDQWSIKPGQKIVSAIREKHPEIPIIAFPRGAGAKTERYAQMVKPDGLSMDTSVPMDQAVELQKLCIVQGNLDPVSLLAGGDVLDREIDRRMENLSKGPYIFNLGHGVIKETPPEHVAQLVKRVRDYHG